MASYRAPIIGDFGQRAIGSEMRAYEDFALPPEYSPAALAMLSRGELERLRQMADEGYDAIEQSDNPYQRLRYIDPAQAEAMRIALDNDGVYRDAQGNEYVFEPEYSPEDGGAGHNGRFIPVDDAWRDVQRQQGQLRLQQQIMGLTGQRIEQLRQQEIMQRNRAMAGLAEAGYQFAPGALNDPNVQDFIMQNRFDLNAIARGGSNFVSAPGQRAAWNPVFTMDDLRRMRVPVTGFNGDVEQPVMGPGGLQVPGGGTLPVYQAPMVSGGPELGINPAGSFPVGAEFQPDTVRYLPGTGEARFGQDMMQRVPSGSPYADFASDMLRGGARYDFTRPAPTGSYADNASTALPRRTDWERPTREGQQTPLAARQAPGVPEFGIRDSGFNSFATSNPGSGQVRRRPESGYGSLAPGFYKTPANPTRTLPGMVTQELGSDGRPQLRSYRAPQITQRGVV